VQRSGQVLAALSSALWQTHQHLALLLPALEWRLLHWVVKRVGCSWQLLLGPAVAAPALVDAGQGSFVSSSKLSKVKSHPIGDWAHPGLMAKLKQLSDGPSVIRLPSHPLSAEALLQSDLMVPCAAAASAGGCCIRGAAGGAADGAGYGTTAGRLPQVECRGATGATAAAPLSADWADKPACYSTSSSRSGVSGPGAASISLDEAWGRCCRDGGSCSGSFGVAAPAVSCGSSDLTTPIASCRSGCCCRGSSSRASGTGSASSSICRGSSSHSCCHSCCGSCCSGSSHGRVREGGRRHRKLVVKLVQAAGARLAHTLLSVLEHPGGGLAIDDEDGGYGGEA